MHKLVGLENWTIIEEEGLYYAFGIVLFGFFYCYIRISVFNLIEGLLGILSELSFLNSKSSQYLNNFSL